MIKKILPLLLIILLATFLRFYKLAQVPQGMAWDEAAIAYNGYAVLTTRRDEWLNKLPISFRSFGDYKAPLAIYQSGIFTWVFGMNLWAVRLPFAIWGVLAVLAIYLFFKELFWKNPDREKWALLAAFILAVSPWHLHYSRLAFESGLALALLLWALYFFYRYLRLKKISSFLLATFLASSTLYAYHSSKITVPLLFILLIWMNHKFFKRKGKSLLIAGSLALLILCPLILDALAGQGLTRANSTIFAISNSWLELLRNFFGNTLSYFSLDFLIFGKNMGNFRHGDGRFGIIEPLSLILIIFYVFFRRYDKKLFPLSLTLIALGLLPAILAEGQSSSNRSLLALPGIILLVVLSVKEIWQALKEHKKLFYFTLIGFYGLILGAYQYNYYKNYPTRSSDDFMDGYLETFAYLRSLDRSQIKQIVFTSDYQHPYIYALFTFEVNPIAYQGGILNLFFFADQINAGDLNKEDTIVVASKFDQMGERVADKIIKGGDGQGRFFIYLPL